MDRNPMLFLPFIGMICVTFMIIFTSQDKEVVVITTEPVEGAVPDERDTTEDGDTLYFYQGERLLNN